MNKPIKSGILAFGMSGRLFHAPFLHTHPGFSLRAVTERHNKQAKSFYPELVSYDTPDELISDGEIELIVVNTPNNTHYAYAKLALMAGKHVLIEKPAGTSAGEVKELYHLAATMKREIMIYQNRRWDSDFQSVKTVVESGVLGKLVEAHFRFDRYRTSIENKAFKEEPIPGSGLAWNLGPHLLDQVISLFGKPERYQKTTASHRLHSKVDDYFFFHFIYPGNMNVYIHGSLLVPQSLPAYVLHGVSGSYIKNRLDVQEAQLQKGISPCDSNYGMEDPEGGGELTLISSKGDKTVQVLPPSRGNYNELFDAVFQQIRNNEPYPVKKEEILLQMEMLEAAST